MQCITALYIEQTILPLRNYDIGLHTKLDERCFQIYLSRRSRFRFIAFSPSISILGYALKMSKRIVSKLFPSLFFPFFLHPLRPSDFRSRILGKFEGEVRSRCSARSCICTKTMPLSTSLRINLPQSIPSFISLARINRSVEKYGRSRV